MKYASNVSARIICSRAAGLVSARKSDENGWLHGTSVIFPYFTPLEKWKNSVTHEGFSTDKIPGEQYPDPSREVRD